MRRALWGARGRAKLDQHNGLPRPIRGNSYTNPILFDLDPDRRTTTNVIVYGRFRAHPRLVSGWKSGGGVRSWKRRHMAAQPSNSETKAVWVGVLLGVGLV